MKPLEVPVKGTCCFVNNCPHSRDCANHTSAGQHREQGGETPFLIITEEKWVDDNSFQKAVCSGPHPDGHRGYLTFKNGKWVADCGMGYFDEVSLGDKDKVKLFLVHCGYYDTEIDDGLFENHYNFFVVAKDERDARVRAKADPLYQRKKMHIDGLQEIQAVNGFQIKLEKELSSAQKTVIINHKHRG